jgi:hypothetical protein
VGTKGVESVISGRFSVTKGTEAAAEEEVGELEEEESVGGSVEEIVIVRGEE